MSETYIFGYGSLISSESRSRTGYSGDAIPCVVKGVQREWNLLASENRMTAVGATLNPDALCNGVIAPIEKSELPKFDKREAGYHRSKIDRASIRIINNLVIPEGDIWIYIPDKVQKPSSENPIVQSYVDVILSGCFDYGEDFVKEFIKTTLGWNYPWINDRQDPRYSRAMNKVLLASEIDSLLEQHIPVEFLQRG